MSDLTVDILANRYRALQQEPMVFRYSYRTGSLHPLMGPGENKQCQSKMLGILEGVMEILPWGDKDRFEAAVHTEEGPKRLKGTVESPYSSVDIQSGAISGWPVAFREADQAIRKAYDTLLPKEAIRVISMIWEQLDRTSELAAARSRLLIGKLGKPRLAPLPAWFENQRANLIDVDEDDIAANPCAVTSAEFLVQAALAAIPQTRELEAEIEIGPMGRVVIDWRVPKGRLQWMVEAIDIPWPSAKVYQVSHQPDLENPNALKSRIFYNAFDVLDSFVEFLNSN